MRLVTAKAALDFGAGPIALDSDDDLATLGEDDRVLVAFADCEQLFIVIGRANRALHLGSWLSPYEYLHWRLDRNKDRWSLSTSDRAEIEALRRFYDA